MLRASPIYLLRPLGICEEAMFERYTERARRVVFFSRYEASQFGSPYIDTEHLLLGLLREDKALAHRFLPATASMEAIRQQIERHSPLREKFSTSVDLPLSNECKRILAYTAEEAERLDQKYIDTPHLLLGLLREERCFAAELLQEYGVQLGAVREQLANEDAARQSNERRRTPSGLDRLRHDRIREHLAFSLRQFVETNPLGRVMTNTAFHLEDTVHVPDVAFVPAERLKGIDPGQRLSVRPALVIEVVSVNDLAADLVDSVDQYLRSGVSCIWLIYPNVRQAHIFRSDRDPRIVSGQQPLAEETLLPGFSLALNTVLFD